MNTVEFAKLIAEYLTPILVVVIGFWFNTRLKELDRQNERRNQIYQDKKEQRKAEIERRHEPHIEFTIATNFIGPPHGFYMAEFVIYASNKSLVQHKFREINLRVRGIRHDQTPKIWKGREPRLEFPEKLFETELKPEKWNFMFVEPGVTQLFTFITRIEESLSCITARAEFHYDKHTPHSIERVFPVQFN